MTHYSEAAVVYGTYYVCAREHTVLLAHLFVNLDQETAKQPFWFAS